jgi:hypothetical protein
VKLGGRNFTDYITWKFMICTLISNYSGDQINTNEMTGACSMYGTQERCIQGFGGET